MKVFLVLLLLIQGEGHRAALPMESVEACQLKAAEMLSENRLSELRGGVEAIGVACEVHFNPGTPS